MTLRYPSRSEQCETCIFRNDGKQMLLAPGRLQEVKAYLVKGQTHNCHTDAHLACRGGRQFQADMWHQMRILEKPTVECLEETAIKTLSR